MLCIILCPLVCVRDISVFSSCHIIADIIIIVSTVYIEIYAIVNIMSNGVKASAVPYTNIFSAMEFLGIATGAFEISGVVIPIYQQAANKSSYPRIQNIAFSFVAILYGTFGTFGYLAFGDEVEGPVTISLNQRKLHVEIIELVYVAALFPTTLIQIYPPIQIIEQYTARKIRSDSLKDLVRIAVRLTLMAGAIWLAVGIGEKFDLVLSFVGNFAGGFASLIYFQNSRNFYYC